jgi:hypothetical protein
MASASHSLFTPFFWIDGKTSKTAFTQFLQPRHTPALKSTVASDQMALNINTAGTTKKRSTALCASGKQFALIPSPSTNDRVEPN